MKRTFSHYLTGLLVLLILTLTHYSQPPQRDPAKEQPVYEELLKIAPKSVENFKKATEALDADKFDEAVSLFQQVLKESPNFEPALRRSGYALAGIGQREAGIAMAQKALDLHRSADNLVGMVYLILDLRSPDAKPSKGDLEKSLNLISEAVGISGGRDLESLTLKTQLSLELDRIADFRQAIGQMRANFPDEVQTHYFSAIDRADEGDFDGAIAEIKVAREQGLLADEADRITTALEKGKQEAHPFAAYLPYIYFFLGVTALWAAGLLALYIIGRRLSKKTLALIEHSDPTDLTGGGHDGLKTTYRRLINFASIYYYISQPMVVLLVIAVTAALILGSLMVGTIPIGFLLGLVFVGGGSIFYMFKSMIIRPKVEDPGRSLRVEEAPELFKLAEAVASDINTRKIDEIRLTPAAEIAVYERGTIREKLRDKGERVLVLGVGTFNDFSINAFRAVLAHEYGHFSNRDTAGGDVAFRINSDMMRLAEAMVNSGTNTYHNLAFHFLRLYHHIYRRITVGASRLQEALADRVAVHTYGSEAFCEGLRHVAWQELIFNKAANSEIAAAVADRRKFNNIYDVQSAAAIDADDIEASFKTEFDRATTEEDTHPAGADRVRLAQMIASQVREDISGTVWDLFLDKASVTQSMNLLMEKHVRGDRYVNYYTPEELSQEV